MAKPLSARRGPLSSSEAIPDANVKVRIVGTVNRLNTETCLTVALIVNPTLLGLV